MQMEQPNGSTKSMQRPEGWCIAKDKARDESQAVSEEAGMSHKATSHLSETSRHAHGGILSIHTGKKEEQLVQMRGFFCSHFALVDHLRHHRLHLTSKRRQVLCQRLPKLD